MKNKEFVLFFDQFLDLFSKMDFQGIDNIKKGKQDFIIENVSVVLKTNHNYDTIKLNCQRPMINLLVTANTFELWIKQSGHFLEYRDLELFRITVGKKGIQKIDSKSYLIASHSLNGQITFTF